MKRIKIGLFLLITLAVLGEGAWLVYQQRLINHEKHLQHLLVMPLTKTHTVEIMRGASVQTIAHLVTQKDFPIDSRDFIRLVKRQKIDTSLKAGHYRFDKGKTVYQVLDAIANGKTEVKKITIIEGMRFSDIRQQLENDSRLVSRLNEFSNDALRKELAVQYPSLEGLILPETYYFTPGDTDLSIIRRAHKRMQTTINRLWQTQESPAVINSPYEAIILASIVEKETGKAEERPLIARVFINRLQKGMRLQADPTVIYGLQERFQGNLTKKHLREDTTYNTYVHKGLTPTPIALPSKEALEAVFSPADNNKYIYFVATGDGGHYFSKTLREHNNAVNRYQRRRKSQ